MRAMLPVFPPAAKGTTITTDLCGHSAEWAGMAKLKLIKAMNKVKDSLDACITVLLDCYVVSSRSKRLIKFGQYELLPPWNIGSFGEWFTERPCSINANRGRYASRGGDVFPHCRIERTRWSLFDEANV